MFGMFDFDKAFNCWNGLKGKVVTDDIHAGMIKKLNLNRVSVHAFMLPVPRIEAVSSNVARADGSHWGDRSYCTLEHLFYGLDQAADYFTEEETPGTGSRIVFKGDKVRFVEGCVPELPDECFMIFRPIFEYVVTQINVWKAVVTEVTSSVEMSD